MFDLDWNSYTYYVRPGRTDMRKGSRSLAVLVLSVMGKDPCSKSVFLFCGKSRKQLKALVWDNGFWVMARRIERGTFRWPDTEEEAAEISLGDVRRLLKGQDVFRRLPELESVLL